jgi:hypothetical protein
LQDELIQVLVVQALHVDGHPDNSMNYKSTVDDLRPVYKRLAMKYRMMIYSGDVDACVPYYASEDWTRELGFKVGILLCLVYENLSHCTLPTVFQRDP